MLFGLVDFSTFFMNFGKSAPLRPLVVGQPDRGADVDRLDDVRHLDLAPPPPSPRTFSLTPACRPEHGPDGDLPSAIFFAPVTAAIMPGPAPSTT